MSESGVQTIARWSAVIATALVVATPAHAVPAFARQTGLDCTTCHLSWPELTSVGREFKLGGYTLIQESKGERPLVSLQSEGPPPLLPLAAMAQVSYTSTRGTANADAGEFPRNDAVALQQASLFYAGRIVEHLGAFAQWSYDGIAHHGSIDNVDIRLANRSRIGDIDASYGITINNNPTVSDIYNTTPAWGFPFAASSVAVTPNAATLIDGGLEQQVVAAGAYALWAGTLYTEVAAYRTADGAFSVFRAGTDKSTDAVLDGAAPYWRLALQHTWGEGIHSAMIGAFGIDARKFPDSLDATGPTDRFLDNGFDAQYQYLTDRHRFSAQASFIHEKQSLDGSFASGSASNASDVLRSFKAKATYYYDKQYGGTLAYFRTSGSSDEALYDTGDPVTGSANASPSSNGWIFELDWLPRRDIRIAAQYTAYHQFNGASSNYDGFGRSARDNDTLYLIAWLMF